MFKLLAIKGFNLLGSVFCHVSVVWALPPVSELDAFCDSAPLGSVSLPIHQQPGRFCQWLHSQERFYLHLKLCTLPWTSIVFKTLLGTTRYAGHRLNEAVHLHGRVKLRFQVLLVAPNLPLQSRTAVSQELIEVHGISWSKGKCHHRCKTKYGFCLYLVNASLQLIFVFGFFLFFQQSV